MKKVVLSFIAFTLLGIMSVQSQQFAGGSGTATDPYLISTVQHLDNIREYCGALPGKYYKMTADIDLSVVENWEPLSMLNAVGSGSNNRCYIYLDGDGHIIKNLTSKKPGVNSAYSGLVGVLSGSVKNLGLVNVDIDGDGAGAIAGYVGSAAGNLDVDRATVENCFVTGTVIGRGKVGGVAGAVGKKGSSVRNCYSTCDVTNYRAEGKDYAGGVVGALLSTGAAADLVSTVENCYATGTIKALHKCVGGVVGWSDGAVIGCIALNKHIEMGNDETSDTDAQIGTVVGSVGTITMSVGTQLRNVAKSNISMVRKGVAYTPTSFNDGVISTPVDGVIKDNDYLSNALNIYSDLGFSMVDPMIWRQENYQIYPQLYWVSERADAAQIDGLHEQAGGLSYKNELSILVYAANKQLCVKGCSGAYDLVVYGMDGRVLVKQEKIEGDIILPFDNNGIFAVEVISEKGGRYSTTINQ